MNRKILKSALVMLEALLKLIIIYLQGIQRTVWMFAAFKPFSLQSYYNIFLTNFKSFICLFEILFTLTICRTKTKKTRNATMSTPRVLFIDYRRLGFAAIALSFA